MNHTQVMRMTEHECHFEEQILGQSRVIAELEAKSNYKEKIIEELYLNMKELKTSITQLDETINKYMIESVKDDNELQKVLGELKDIINKQDNRITALETAESERWKMYLGLGTAVAIATFVLSHVFR